MSILQLFHIDKNKFKNIYKSYIDSLHRPTLPPKILMNLFTPKADE